MWGCHVWKEPWRCILRGYAGSPYTQRGTPVGLNAYWQRSRSNWESVNMPASCFLPSRSKIDCSLAIMYNFHPLKWALQVTGTSIEIKQVIIQGFDWIIADSFSVCNQALLSCILFHEARLKIDVHVAAFMHESWKRLAFYNLPTGPFRFPIKPLGKETLWNFRACTLLCPLYRILWCSPGLDIGLTVPSINPKQFGNGAPLAVIAST